jgi:hypothetical protein
MGIIRILLLFCFALGFNTSRNQVVNGYASVTAIVGNELTLSNVNETFDSFEDGEYVIVMQMQDNVIGTTTNVATFGDLGSILSAGLYEIKQISSHTEAAGIPVTITLSSLTNSYNVGANSSVQVITFPQLGSPDYTTAGTLTALDWDGNIGGVLAFEVAGVLTIANNISADAQGFRGGDRSANFNGPVCTAASVTRYRENNNQLGYKGEGIYKSTDPLYTNGRGNILNGGGGGSNHNAGGGGGGNFVSGGLGGNGYNNCTTNPAGGFGGLSLSAHISASRIFMGGGGGGGQQNNTQGRAGGDGGGIIVIKANEVTTGTCAGLSITANGVGPATNGTNDGGGGGGAGGTIILQVQNWNVSASCPLTISANGGSGSTSNNASAHAGGGGGSQGVVIFNAVQPSTNITTTATNGLPGCNNNSSPCTNSAGAPTGANDDGILDNLTGPLPVELLYFSVELEDNNNAFCFWSTASEKNNSHFIIERSFNGWQWFEVGRIEGNGTSVHRNDYSFRNYNLSQGVWYYRLIQVDFDGNQNVSAVVSVEVDVIGYPAVYPNPTNDILNITIPKEHEVISYEITDATGKRVFIEKSLKHGGAQISLANFPQGIYFIRFSNFNGLVSVQKFIKKD